MTQTALRQLGFPQKRVEIKSFTEVVKRALAEQFIEPLFVDEGNIRRYSYEYVQKAHSLRQQLLKEMSSKARNMDEISEKIKIVYDSIMLDNFAFQFRNDDELAAKLKVQEEYNRLSIEMIDEMETEIKKEQQGNKLALTRVNEIFEKISAKFIEKLHSRANEISKKCKGVLYYTEGYKNELKETFTRFNKDDNKVFKAQENLLIKKEDLFKYFEEYKKDLTKLDTKLNKFVFEGEFELWFEKEFEVQKATEDINFNFQQSYRNTFRVTFNTTTGNGRFNYFEQIR